jgi:hypothetical protein
VSASTTGRTAAVIDRRNADREGGLIAG